MNRNNSSDEHSTMAASLSFEAILRDIQASNLNFWIEMSPFSAVINLKKSLIKNKLGVPLISPPPILLVSQDR